MEKREKDKWKKRCISMAIVILCGAALFLCRQEERKDSIMTLSENEYIKWVDFNVSYEALCQAYEIDLATYKEETHIDWIELLAYCAAKNGGELKGSMEKEMNKIVEKVKEGETTIAEEGKDLKYYDYYYEAYSAVLGEYVGEYKIEVPASAGNVTWESRYGLKVFSPIAKGFEYSDYDDFGASRSYGYNRPHLGHDMMGQTGTPIWIKY